MTATRQLPWRHRRNVSVEIRGIERQHVGRKLEPGHGRVGNRDLCLLQLLISDLPGHPMIGLSAECRRRQTRQARHSAIQKLRQVPLRSGRARSLDGYRHGQLADRRAASGAKVAARPVDVPYQIELLGNPDQRADISNCLCPYRSRGTQIRDRRRCCRAQHNLARNGTATDWVPDRLGRDTVAEAIHISFEDMHIFHVACIRPKRKRHTIFYGTGATHDALLSFRNAKVGLGPLSWDRREAGVRRWPPASQNRGVPVLLPTRPRHVGRPPASVREPFHDWLSLPLATLPSTGPPPSRTESVRPTSSPDRATPD